VRSGKASSAEGIANNLLDMLMDVAEPGDISEQTNSIMAIFKKKRLGAIKPKGLCDARPDRPLFPHEDRPVEVDHTAGNRRVVQVPSSLGSLSRAVRNQIPKRRRTSSMDKLKECSAKVRRGPLAEKRRGSQGGLYRDLRHRPRAGEPIGARVFRRKLSPASSIPRARSNIVNVPVADSGGGAGF